LSIAIIDADPDISIIVLLGEKIGFQNNFLRKIKKHLGVIQSEN
jgi:hypothetical protein